MTGGATDWDAMAAVWLERPPDGLWRRHSDAVNWGLLERWLPPRLERVLKTDLFDEAVGDFSVAYADQAERDHAALKAAVRRGTVTAFRETA